MNKSESNAQKFGITATSGHVNKPDWQSVP